MSDAIGYGGFWFSICFCCDMMHLLQGRVFKKEDFNQLSIGLVQKWHRGASQRLEEKASDYSCQIAGQNREFLGACPAEAVDRSKPVPAPRDEADGMISGFFLIMVLIQASEGRGPHHPRGEAVVKHVHYRPTKTAPEKLTQDAELLHDKEHLQEHLEEIIKEPDLSKMTDEELEFYYFQVHDTDKNSKLDGLEILNAILHTAHEEKHEEGEDTHSLEDFEYYVELIDRVLAEDDSDKDGYLSYPEYTSGRRNAIIAENRNQPSVKMVSHG
ncbi:uncharacterized protein LOC664432 [Tribolium castaneum]|uniref:uncharacterized protein LOC664432 n=1 Tax=Tribolium castaneum TaxID=7070 RepID=UPI00046C0E99